MPRSLLNFRLGMRAFLISDIVVMLQRHGDLKVEGNELVPADMSGQEADEDIVF